LQASAFACEEQIERAHFSQPLLCEVGSAPKPSRSSTQQEVRPRELLLRDAVDDALRMTNGNLSEAARRLGMARSTLYRILHREPRHGASD